MDFQSENKKPMGAILKQALKDNMVLPMEKLPTFEDLSEDFPDDQVPYLDKKDIDESKLSKEQKFWRDNGYLILPNFIPDSIVDAYLDLRKRTGVSTRGWESPLPYMFFEEVKDLCLYKPLDEMLTSLIGDKMGMHFNISKFHSTGRGWHQDDYLNPPSTHSWYLASWIALGDIDPDCGPFEFVPGSHKWPCMKSDKVKAFLKPEARNVWGAPGQNGHWAQHAEVFVNQAYLDKLRRSGIPTKSFLGKKGDVLIWHGKLLHCASVAKRPELERPAMITHYSRIATRRDIGDRIKQHKDGGHYWEFPKEAYLSEAPDIKNMERMMREIAMLSDKIELLQRKPIPMQSGYESANIPFKKLVQMLGDKIVKKTKTALSRS